MFIHYSGKKPRAPSFRHRSTPSFKPGLAPSPREAGKAGRSPAATPAAPSRAAGAGRSRGAMAISAEGREFLHAVRNDDVDAAHLLWRLHADALLAPAGGGAVALRAAAKRGSQRMVTFLLDAGISAAATDADGRSAVDYARDAGHGGLADLLDASPNPPPRPPAPAYYSAPPRAALATPAGAQTARRERADRSSDAHYAHRPASARCGRSPVDGRSRWSSGGGGGGGGGGGRGRKRARRRRAVRLVRRGRGGRFGRRGRRGLRGRCGRKR